MKLLIKNKLFSLRGSSRVTDENENPVFCVQGKFFSWTHKKRVEDMNGKTLYVVRDKFFRFIMPSCYVFDGEGNKLCKIKKKFTLFSNKFFVRGYGHEINLDGDIIAHDFVIYRDGQPIGTVKQHFLVLTDTFLLESFNDADAPFLVALIIAVDNIYDRIERGQRSSNN